MKEIVVVWMKRRKKRRLCPQMKPPPKSFYCTIHLHISMYLWKLKALYYQDQITLKTTISCMDQTWLHHNKEGDKIAK